ncbi:MAG: sigma-E processing peptidase SpoIIGA [Anaeroplasma sp.]|nr:sigma-E processing peptidase SpoIIGA [Anaeroplasma sp.]
MNYIEIILLIDLAIHIILVIITNYIFKRKTRYFLLAISCIINLLYMLAYILIPYLIESYKYLLILLISIIPFVSKNIILCLYQLILYLFLNFTLGGFSQILYQTINNFYSVCISVGVFYFVFILLALYKKTHYTSNKLLYDILIIDERRKYYLKGYCDTGNFLSTDNNVPIVFINSKYKIGKLKKEIEIRTVSLVKTIKIYKVNAFLIKVNKRYVKKDVYIAFTNMNHMAMFGLNLLGG